MSKRREDAPRIRGPDDHEVLLLQSSVYRNLSEAAAKLLARGATQKGTAATLGIDRSTITRWLREPHFDALVETQKTAYEQELLEKIRKSGEKSHLWTANAWLLERSQIFEGKYDPPHVKENRGQIGNITVQIAIASPRNTEVADIPVITAETEEEES